MNKPLNGQISLFLLTVYIGIYKFTEIYFTKVVEPKWRQALINS